jgi:hypothetical protein
MRVKVSLVIGFIFGLLLFGVMEAKAGPQNLPGWRQTVTVP